MVKAAFEIKFFYEINNHTIYIEIYKSKKYLDFDS
jgi:hypothetical protein